MKSFTALHRSLGRPPGALTSEMVDDAIAQGAAEGTDLDFKVELPPASNLPQTDFPKDVAAMANSGGGTIVYGIEEDQKRAVGRRDVGELSENHERTLRSAAVTAISPPVFGLQIERIGVPGQQCVAVTVPATLDGPHLIYKNDYFGAPLRNDADTVWMKERQIEAMYRARFDRRRDLTEELDRLYVQTAAGRDTTARAWLIAAATPRLPAVHAVRMRRDEASACFEHAVRAALQLAPRNRGGVHPLEVMDRSNLRTGLRCWTAPNAATGTTLWREAWASIGERGAVTLATAIGGHRRSSSEHWPGYYVEAAGLECAVADFLGLIRAAADHLSTAGYDLQIGIEWAGAEAVAILAKDPYGFPVDPGDSYPVHFVPVRSTVVADADAVGFHRQAHEIALDCVNQGGISHTASIEPAP